MKLYEIVKAGASLRKLIGQDLSLKTAYRLSLLVDGMNKHLSYFDRNREKIAPLADKGDAELDALLQEEVDFHPEKVTVSLDEGVKLSTSDVMNLREFVEFEEPSNG